MDHFVYILKSDTSGRYYTGMSNDPEVRLKHHNLGMNASTKHGIPWKRVWVSIAMPKSAALQLEKKVKKRGAARFLTDTSEGHA